MKHHLLHVHQALNGFVDCTDGRVVIGHEIPTIFGKTETFDDDLWFWSQPEFNLPENVHYIITIC